MRRLEKRAMATEFGTQLRRPGDWGVKGLEDAERGEGFLQGRKRWAEGLEACRLSDYYAGCKRARQKLFEQARLSDAGFAPKQCDGTFALCGTIVERL